MIFRLLSLICVLFIAVGCGGGGSNDAVGGGGGTSNDQIAGLTFSFVRAQAALEVPSATTSLRFEFFTGANASGVQAQSEQTRDFASQISIRPVSVFCRSVKVTALSREGTALLFGVANVTPVPGQDSLVTFFFSEEIEQPVLTRLQVSPEGENVGVGGLKQFTVLGFDQNGQTFPLDDSHVVWSASPQLSVDSQSGLARGVSVGSATVTATVGPLSATASVTVFYPDLEGIVSITPDPVLLQYGVTTSAELITVGRFGTAGTRPLTNATDSLNYFVSGAPDVIEVTSDGEINALAVGETEVTASVGAYSQTVRVQVDFGPEGNETPELTVDAAELVVYQDTPALPFEFALLGDDQASMSGGRLTVRVRTGETVGLSLNAPAGIDIGDHQGSDGSASLVVDLDQGATTKKVAEFLRGMTLTSGSSEAPLGEGALEVLLEDGQGQMCLADRRFVVVGASALVLTVYPDQAITATNFPTIGAALAKVRTGNGSFRGSLVTVGPGDFSSEGRLRITSDADFRGLRLRGANAGNPVGAVAVDELEPYPMGLTEVSRWWVEAPEVTLDGFCSGVFGEPPADGDSVVIVTGEGFTLSNCIFKDDTPQRALGIYFVEGVEGVHTVRDSRFLGFQQGLQCYRPGSGSRLVVTSNLFLENLVGAHLKGIAEMEFSGNRFQQSDRFHISIDLEGRNLTGLSGNDFPSGSVYVHSSTGGTPVLTAPGNWWGQVGGPQGQTPTAGGASIVTEPSSSVPLTRE